MLSKGTGTIVVGYNRGWKDSIRIGKRNNQTFVQIPYETLNIMRKVFNDSTERIIDRGLLFNPMKLNDLWHLPRVA